MNVNIFSLVTIIYLISFVLLLTSEIIKNISIARIGKIAVAAGFILHTAGIIIRWVESYHAGIGHAPLSNFYESLVFFSWVITLLYLIYSRKGLGSLLGVFLMPASFLLMAYASFSPSVSSGIQPLIPALKSNWLIIHVVTCFLGYAAFFIASASGIAFLVRKDIEQRLGMILDSSLRTGFILFTLGIVTGSVWAYFTWGDYWTWDPKETWALITWLTYAGAIHERMRTGRISRGVMIITAIGLLSVIFTYFGVNYLPSIHNYK
jgi:ABC-type transport system involved in cytochrome c biogenesis permease subunit